MSSDRRDVFISYASEDRLEVARPLAELLISFGVSVWYDEFDLKMGDNLRRKIDAGLAECRFGIAVISEHFFAKHYPQIELDGLAQREVGGEKVILPIWVAIDERGVRGRSPSLADRIAARWEDGLATVALKVLEVVRPDVLDKFRQNPPYTTLSRLRTGRDLAAILGGVHFSYHYHDEPESPGEADLVAGFFQEAHDWSDIWSDIEPGDHVRTQFRLGELIRELEGAGWSAYGIKRSGKGSFGGVQDHWTWYILAAVRGEPADVLHSGNNIFVARRPPPESAA
jgi:hypothetical protein